MTREEIARRAFDKALKMWLREVKKMQRKNRELHDDDDDLDLEEE